MRVLNGLIVFYLLLALPAQAQNTLGFSQLWAEVRAHSARLAELGHRVTVTQLEKNRAALFWLPSLSLDGRVFSTNDPALSFSSILGERRFTVADFDANSLNHPGFNTFETLSLGIDLPLYDGGLRSSSADHAEKMSESLSYAQSYQVLAVYVETGGAYARVVSLIQAEQQLKSMSEKANRLLAHYSVGNKSNLLGYSGLLGIKGLINRIESVRNEVQAESEAGISRLSLQGQLSVDWTPRLDPTRDFLERIMPLSKSTQANESLTVKSARAEAEAAESNGRAQKSQELPHLGLFASDSLTHGSRDTASGFTGGLYLKWSLFNPAQLGKVREVKELQQAEASKVDQAKLETRGEQEKSIKMETALLKNLKLLEESESYLEDQTKAITQLYRNGSVTALQLVEVLNRGVDLVLQLKDLQFALIEHRSQQKLLEAGEGASDE